MPETPDIDQSPEQIDAPDQSSTADAVPNPTTEQAAEVLTSGTDNPQPQIEAKAVNLIQVLNRLQNLSVESFFASVTGDTDVLAEQRVYFKDSLMIDVEADNLVTAFAKVYALDRFQGLDTDDLAKVYGVPIEQFGEKVAFKPQICLKFRETQINQTDLPIRDRKLVKEISFRLLGDNIPKNFDDLNNLRDKILAAFSGYTWAVSNQNTYTYRDFSRGYRLAIDIDKEGFIELVTKVLSIQDDTYDEQYTGDKKVNRPLTPPKAIVLGKEVDLPFRGRYGNVTFWKAEYKQAGIADKIIATNLPFDQQ